ncbi:NnrU family protein [Frateuria sp. STR12]|uniref:NnrU family protein n=1 Tax=Frateuria hangzhouensis TaxID=2995589 RepID=UPI002260A9D9|nr:NnrU family protein [Frateuria sp. STR12]MCX7514524.1 NnrU family protein [Frateuria sp. STR12]
MQLMIIGLFVFLGVHVLPLVFPRWRQRQIDRFGERTWKGLFALVALAGLVLICWGFGRARDLPLVLYAPPPSMDHLNALFTLVAFVLVAAAYVPRNHIKAALGQPMLLGVLVWASGHLLATGMLYDVVLFGAFLSWSLPMAVWLRQRDRLTGVRYAAGTLRGDLLAVVIGVVAWAIFAFWLHRWLIGVDPMAGMH